MEYDKDLLKEELRHRGITQLELANVLKIDKRTVCHKINGIAEWNISEMFKICDFLRVESLDILFTKRNEQN